VSDPSDATLLARGGEIMKIEILYVTDCPHYDPAVELVEQILREEGVCAEIQSKQICDLAAALAAKFPGSPTIRINGRDVEAGTGSDVAAVGCRLYPGTGGVPSLDTIRSAVRAEKQREGL
jgi:hypothetical protein